MIAHCTGGSGSALAPYFAEFVGGRRGEILDAALSVFAEKGYEGGTMREIAARLGVTEPALYRHYAGKEALFDDLIAVAADHVVEKAGGVVDSLEPARLRESLLALIGGRRHKHGDATKPVMRTIFAAAPHNAAFREAFRTHLARPMLERVAAFVPRVDALYGIERTRAQLESALRAFLSLFVGYFMTGMMLELPDDDEGVVDAMMSLMGWVPDRRSE